jgi:hypothetical protein
VCVSEEAFVDARLSPVGIVGEGFEGLNGSFREWVCGVFSVGFEEERGIADVRVRRVVRVVRMRVWCISVAVVDGVGFWYWCYRV